MKLSFDFPEPSVEFAGYRFGFLVFTRENAYALDASTMTADGTGDALTVTATGLTWAGGQVKASGRVDARQLSSGGGGSMYRARPEALIDGLVGLVGRRVWGRQRLTRQGVAHG